MATRACIVSELSEVSVESSAVMRTKTGGTISTIQEVSKHTLSAYPFPVVWSYQQPLLRLAEKISKNITEQSTTIRIVKTRIQAGTLTRVLSNSYKHSHNMSSWQVCDILSIDKTCPRWIEFITDYITHFCECPPASMIFTQIYSNINNATTWSDLYSVYTDLIDNPFDGRTVALAVRCVRWYVDLLDRWQISRLRISEELASIIEI
jgi:hypothetical protein